MAPMAQQKPTPEPAQRDRAISDARSGLNAGANFGQFAVNTENAYRTGSGGWDWMRQDIFLGFQFLNLTPELGRYMRENQTLNAQVLSGSDYSLGAGSGLVTLLWGRFRTTGRYESDDFPAASLGNR